MLCASITKKHLLVYRPNVSIIANVEQRERFRQARRRVRMSGSGEDDARRAFKTALSLTRFPPQGLVTCADISGGGSVVEWTVPSAKVIKFHWHVCVRVGGCLRVSTAGSG